MTKKDYVAIARILATEPGMIVKQDLVDKLCMLYRYDNPRFDEDKFRQACYAE